MAASGEALVLISGCFCVFLFGCFFKLGASVSLWVPMVTSDLLSKELSSEWPPSGEGLEKPIGQCVLAGRS